MRFHGLFIGVDRYVSPLVNELTCAARDAQALHAMFADNLGDDGTVLLCDDQATREAIRQEFEDRLMAVGPDDLVIVTYSGHGSDDHYVLTHNADPLDFERTAISLDEVIDWFAGIPARNVLLILDCCFSGGAGARVFHRGFTTRAPRSTEAILQQVSGSGRVVFTACGPDEEAIEDQRKGHGLLTQYLLEALAGVPEVVSAGKIGLFSLLEYVTRRVTEVAATFGHPQHPNFRGTVDGEVSLPVLMPGIRYTALFPNRVRSRVGPDVNDLAAYGLPQAILDVWCGAIPGLNELQQQAVNEYGLLDGEHLVVSAPTSSGKTMVGELAALAAYFDRKRTLFLLPLKALVNDKHAEFLRKYGEFGLRIIRATGDNHDDVPELLRGRYDLCLMTYEKFTALALAHPHILHQVGVVVVDEVQMLADRGRGANLEFLLTLIRTRRAEGVEPQIIALSAVIGQTNGLERWLGARLLRSETRPVPLWEGIIRGDGSFRYVDEATNEHLTPMIRPEYRKGSSQDYIIPLLRKLVAEGEKVVVFRPTKGETRGVAGYLASSLGLSPAADVIEALPGGDMSAASATLRECLAGGVAFHNADLDRDERLAVEVGFRNPSSPLRILIATTTVAMGVNTPASSVVIAGLNHPDGPYSVAEYKNMVGRAGRLGHAERGKSYVVAPSAADEARTWKTYVLGRPEDLLSRFAEADLLSLIARVLATTESAQAEFMSETGIVAFLESSFGAFQHAQKTGSPPWNREAILQGLCLLCQHGLVADETGGYRLTSLGRLSGETGAAVSSVIRLVDALRGIPSDHLRDTALLIATQATIELDDIVFPVHKTSHQERQLWRQTVQGQGIPAQILNVLYRTARDEAQCTARCKRAAAVLLWLEGTELRRIEASLLRHMPGDDAAGAIRAVADRTRDLFPVTARVAEILNHGQVDFGSSVEDLLVRLEFGVPGKMAALAAAAGAELSRGDYLALQRASIYTAESIASRSDDDLRTILGDSRKVASLRRAGHTLLELSARKAAAAAAESDLPLPGAPSV